MKFKHLNYLSNLAKAVIKYVLILNEFLLIIQAALHQSIKGHLEIFCLLARAYAK